MNTTFKTYIREAGQAESFSLDDFKRNCKPFLEKIRGLNGTHQLYHGSGSPPPDFEIRTFRERKGPRDSPIELHDAFNKFFTRKFGVPARNWLFTTGSRSYASQYARGGQGLLAVFPIGDFQWLSGLDAELSDLTEWYFSVKDEISDEYASPAQYSSEIVSKTIDQMVSEADTLTWKFNTDLIKCIEKRNEIMLKSQKYYVFSVIAPTYTKHVLPFLHQW